MSSKNLTTSEFYLPYNQELVARAKKLRKNMTIPEKKLWYGFLNHFSLRVLRQRPINNFIVDFYCAKLKLVIEVDGDSHFTDEGRESDRRRTAILESYGLKVIRFTNEEVLHNFDAVCQEISPRKDPPSPP